MIPFNKEHTLVTSAFVGEIDLLQKSLKFPHVLPMGIGNLEQAIQCSKYLVQNPDIKQIVYLGSCGVYPWVPFPIGDIVSPKEVHSEEISSLLGFGKQLPMNPSFHKLEADPSFPPVVCNAPTTITLHQLDEKNHQNWKNFQVENLELFGLAKVANQFQIPITAYLVITNTVEPNGSADWQKNWREFSNQLQRRFLEHKT